MKDGCLQLNENHNYFYQVQGQEGVSEIEYFDSALLTDPCFGLNGLFVQRIYFEKTNGSLSGYQSLQSFISITSDLACYYQRHPFPVIIVVTFFIMIIYNIYMTDYLS